MTCPSCNENIGGIIQFPCMCEKENLIKEIMDKFPPSAQYKNLELRGVGNVNILNGYSWYWNRDRLKTLSLNDLKSIRAICK